MKNKTKVAYYMRRGKPETAVIYVRGDNEEFQEIQCRMYAKEQGYKVAYVTRHIEDINLCDIVLVANFSRISRKQITFAQTCKLFKARGIRIENATGRNNISEAFSAKDIYKSLETFFEKEFNRPLKKD